jgi:hypothetical protein
MMPFILISKKKWKKLNAKERGKVKRIKALTLLFKYYFRKTTPHVEEFVRRNFIGRIRTG